MSDLVRNHEDRFSHNEAHMEIYCGCSIESLRLGMIRIRTHNVRFKEKKNTKIMLNPHGFLLLLTDEHVQHTNLKRNRITKIIFKFRGWELERLTFCNNFYENPLIYKEVIEF